MSRKADTAAKIAAGLERTDDLECIKCCSSCNRVFVFYTNQTSCPTCGDGNLYPLTRYLEPAATE